jgi:hypothetical protein
MSTIVEKYNHRFDYKDGDLYWKEDRGSQKCKGKMAGTQDHRGYLRVRVRELGGSMLVHRIIFAMHHGYLPAEVDHIDGDKSNNRIENLREVTRSQNQMNKGRNGQNKSGCKNVYFYRNKWGVKLVVNKKSLFIGVFESLELADLVAHSAREKYHGDYANHGVN